MSMAFGLSGSSVSESESELVSMQDGGCKVESSLSGSQFLSSSLVSDSEVSSELSSVLISAVAFESLSACEWGAVDGAWERRFVFFAVMLRTSVRMEYIICSADGLSTLKGGGVGGGGVLLLGKGEWWALSNLIILLFKVGLLPLSFSGVGRAA